jgi:hypothetical protein
VSPLCIDVPDAVAESVSLSVSASSTSKPASSSNKSFRDSRETFRASTQMRAPHPPTPLFTALSVEFVAVPQQAAYLQSTIPAEIDSVLQSIEGYAGCMVLISDLEARLITVLTLWQGDARSHKCDTKARWVKQLLTPYADRWLRTQTLITSLKGIQILPVAHTAENFG